MKTGGEDIYKALKILDPSFRRGKGGGLFLRLSKKEESNLSSLGRMKKAISLTQYEVGAPEEEGR